MENRVIQKGRGFSPLPIRDGLNATRARVGEDAAGISAWDFVWELISKQRHRHPEDNEGALRERFRAQEVILRDGTVLEPHTTLKLGQDVYFYRTPAPEIPVPFDIPIVFEDDYILIADKPPFMATMPRARHITETATVRLRRMTGNNALSPAHRLDRLTSGLLLFTKEQRFRGAYQTLFATREVSKTYLAVAPHAPFDTPLQWQSRMEKTHGEIQGRITEGDNNAVTNLMGVERLTGQEQAELEKIHGPQPPLARYTLQPSTGKTHQLRLHLWDAGVPILGDPVYPTILPEDQEDFAVPMHLVAKSFSFTDPFTGEFREFTSPRKR
ncbi:23S rRNA pseudouridylate synthase [Corynebacterium phocae]|uniref:RNA pseudouridylate synthase n=1 Tax=Corynebacterium phocae TaxID=161895 RepID=A0A1L7D5K8_9CORY|nr:pseudouridine synthase [Corynebacterium phocae]APT93456.1 23S rRNA pseudouridylate synthase [Corynebacterium phocae]KAA8721150.1 23S rRNA pseudouridylate synthase [Corynebacterium phocae]